MHEKCPYDLVFYMQSVLTSTMYGFICKVCPYYLVLYMQSVLII